MTRLGITAASALAQLAIGILAGYLATTVFNAGLRGDNVVGGLLYLGIWTLALFADALTARPTALTALFAVAFVAAAYATTVLS